MSSSQTRRPVGRPWRSLAPSLAVFGVGVCAAASTATLLERSEYRYAGEAALAGGLLIAALLTAVVWLLGTSRDRISAKVEEATAALRAEVAHQRCVEEQLRDRESELAAFIAVAAHDLRTPLTNVAAYADLLAEVASEDLDATCLGFVERIGSGTRRMTRLIEDLLDFTTADTAPLRCQSVDLRVLVSDVIAEHTTHMVNARPNISVGILPTVRGNPEALHRLFDNLIGNALKYVRHGDTPAIRISAVRESGSEAASGVDGGAEVWRIDISDRGIGIPPDQREAVFAPFHRERAAEGYPGTGLGLAICKRIAERHGGTIGVDGNPGGGSRFWFTLPVAGPAGASAAVPDSEAREQPLTQR